jgi:hypothetical protein
MLDSKADVVSIILVLNAFVDNLGIVLVSHRQYQNAGYMKDSRFIRVTMSSVNMRCDGDILYSYDHNFTDFSLVKKFLPRLSIGGERREET